MPETGSLAAVLWLGADDMRGTPVQPDYKGYHPCIAEDLISCVCQQSELFFHLRWDCPNDGPLADDGLTMCGRKRSRDKPGFWTTEPGHCGDCTKVMNEAADDMGEDCGWNGVAGE